MWQNYPLNCNQIKIRNIYSLFSAKHQEGPLNESLNNQAYSDQLSNIFYLEGVHLKSVRKHMFLGHYCWWSLLAKIAQGHRQTAYILLICR